MSDPRVELAKSATCGLPCVGTDLAGVRAGCPGSPLLIDTVPLEAPALRRAVDLRRDEVLVEGRVGAAEVDHGLLAALDRPDRLEEQVILDQWVEGSEEDLLDVEVLLLLGNDATTPLLRGIGFFEASIHRFTPRPP